MSALLVLIFALATGDSAAADTPVLALAQSAYQQGNFPTAAALYGRAADRWPNSAEVRYNLGCAEYRAGRTGRAIAAWRRALLLDPDHADARANLEFARSRRVDRIKATEIGAWSKTARFLKDRAPLAFTLANYLFFGLLAAGALARRRVPARTAATAIAGVLFATAVVLLLQRNAAVDTDERVVVVPSADVHAMPQESVPVLAVHDGLEVTVRRSENGYCEVAVGENTLGWVRERNLSERIR